MGADTALLTLVFALSFLTPPTSISVAQAATPVIPQPLPIVRDVVQKTVKPLAEGPKKGKLGVVEVKKISKSIEMCESGGNPNAVNWADAKINGSPSRGPFQFFIKTYIGFALQYGVAKTAAEASKQYWNAAYQRKVAELMIADGLASAHWKICWGKYARSLV